MAEKVLDRTGWWRERKRQKKVVKNQPIIKQNVKKKDDRVEYMDFTTPKFSR